MNTSPACLAAAGVAVCLFGGPAGATGQEPLPGTAAVKVRVVAAPAARDRPLSAWLGLSFELADGWHLYWQNPGDSGGPPEARWTVPPGLTVGPLRWPVPERIVADGLVSYGYHGSVVLPLEIAAPGGWPGAAFAVKAQVKWLACRDICVPGKADVSLDLPARMAVPQAPGAVIRRALDRVPRPAPKNWRVSGTAGANVFTIQIETGRPETAADFFPIAPGQVDAAVPVRSAPSQRGITILLRKSEFLSQPIRLLKGVVTLPGGRAYEIDVPITAQS